MAKTCSTENCTRTICAKGLCRRCYAKIQNRIPEVRDKNNAKRRLRRAANPDSARDSARRRLRYATDPVYRAKETARRQEPAFRERALEASKKHRQNNPDFRNRQSQSERARKCFFPHDLVEACRIFQRGRCAICSREMLLDSSVPAFRECADHCHESSRPRGLLCRICNISLGAYEKYQQETITIHVYEDYLTNPPVKALQALQAPPPSNALPSTHERATELRDSASGTFGTPHGSEKLEDVLQRGSS